MAEMSENTRSILAASDPVVRERHERAVAERRFRQVRFTAELAGQMMRAQFARPVAGWKVVPEEWLPQDTLLVRCGPVIDPTSTDLVALFAHPSFAPVAEGAVPPNINDRLAVLRCEGTDSKFWYAEKVADRSDEYTPAEWAEYRRLHESPIRPDTPVTVGG